jgi:3-hydroxymyristoyl/3-hydroxydecanoyl-(acyl carrier protein) dehydratase
MSMKTLPEIHKLVVEGNKASFVVHLSEDLFYFQGHFPDMEILPGVVQIHWAVTWGRQFLDAGEHFSCMDQVKFHKPVMPGDTLTVSLEWSEETALLAFRYSLGDMVVSSGRVGLKP